MQKIREWGFPVALIALWMVATAYTISLLIQAPLPPEPAQPRPEEHLSASKSASTEPEEES